MIPFRAWRVLAGAAVLSVVLWRTGTGPFVAGLRAVDAVALVLGAAIAVPTTVACAWRWHLVARGLGVGIGLGPAVASCYRAQLLNVTLPGGVVGDVHRGVRHGRVAGDTGRGLRSVAWERVAGQVVQALVALVVLMVVPSPVRPSAAVLQVGAVVVGGVAVGVLVLRALGGRGFLVRGLGRPAEAGVRGDAPAGRVRAAVPRVFRAAREDVRSGVLARPAWPGVALASAVALAGHVATFLVAARAVGVSTSPGRLVPLILLVLIAAALPLNVAGWGPREGMAAWVFDAAGLGAAVGVATAAAYGAIVLVAMLPGAAVLALEARRRGSHRGAVLPAVSGLPGGVDGGAARG